MFETGEERNVIVAKLHFLESDCIGGIIKLCFVNLSGCGIRYEGNFFMLYVKPKHMIQHRDIQRNERLEQLEWIISVSLWEAEQMYHRDPVPALIKPTFEE